MNLPKISIGEFEKQLAAIVGRPTTLRPFVCNGSPLACRVFIVGLNPASPMKATFWDFWRPGIGYDKAAWMDAYVAERAERPLKPGRTRRRRISPSRAVIECLVSELGHTTCLETNIYATAAEDYCDLSAGLRDTKPFDYLLAALKPEVIIVHGADAIAHVQSKAPAAAVLAVPHFSRGWSHESARDLGRKVKQMIGE
jgi:hypothetical protein